ncbi:FHA domain-containing protein [Microbacterium sp.]|uniref:FHA domain-containing protein n=1 Tax=Microbacterium sp. TaxID=51671 RepID=UPI003A937129
MQTTYRPGDWFMLVTPRALIAVAPDAPEELISRLWERESAAGDLGSVIDLLTDQAAGSFAAMLPFAAVVLDGKNARIAVRGDATVQVTGPEGQDAFTGANVTTWSERFVANASRIAIAIGDEEDGFSLPIAGGVVRAAHVSADVEPGDVEPGDVETADAADDVDVVVDAPAVLAEPEPEPEPTPEPAPEPEPEPEPVDDAVEGITLLPTDVTYSSDTDEFDQLFGATVVAPGAPPAPPVPPSPIAAVEGDHDGATISVAEARALRQNIPTAGPDAPTAVLPVVSGGTTGRVRVSTGQVVTLDRTVIIGRRPRSTRASGADLPHLIAVESPQHDISRSHLEIRPEGDTVVVVDLRTTNGSTLLRPGSDPLRLHPGEPTLVLSGDVVDLGDGVTVTFEDLP